MAVNIVPLDKEKHKGKRLRRASGYPQIVGQQMIPLLVNEIPSAAIELPVLFIKDSETGEFRLVGLCGLLAGENLYATEDKWSGIYVPSILRNHPLSLAQTSESGDRWLVCIDEQSPLLNEEKGDLLFDENGEQTDFLKGRYESLMALTNNVQITRAFIQLLIDKELLISKSVQLNLDGEKGVDLGGFYVIDEGKLGELDAAAFLDLRKRGFLSVIYSHLSSLNQMYRLAQKKIASADAS